MLTPPSSTPRHRSSTLPWRSIAGLTAVAAAVGIGGLAFTASNTVPDSKAGDGSGAVSGYTISNVHYNLKTADPTTFDSVTFDLSSTPASTSTIKAKVGGSWYDCTKVVAAVTCDTSASSPSVQATSALQVVVAD